MKRIAVISSRLKCVDAVSIETERWIDKYRKLGYEVHLISGKFGEPAHLPHLELPEIDYKHPEIRGVKNITFASLLDKQGKKAAEILRVNLIKRIKIPLKKYITNNKIDMLSVEDALLSMKNLPLNIALSQIIKETGLPTISRYHYIPWENKFFTKHNNFPKIFAEIPIKGKNIKHITNTESARKKLLEHKKISAKVIPNTVDFEHLAIIDDYNKNFRKDLEIGDDQLIFLQPTRVKRNKSVEKSIKIVAEINEATKKDNVLIITGSPMYQRGNYFEAIIRRIDKLGVKVIFANNKIFLSRHQNKEKRFYSIHDAYVHADFVLYPNISDAFGNPVIEACAYRKPLIVSNYPNLNAIAEKGFKFIRFGQKVDQQTLSDITELTMNKEKLKELTDHNFELVKKYYSAEALDEHLIPILNSLRPEPGIISKLSRRFKKTFKEEKNKDTKDKKNTNNNKNNNNKNTKNTNEPLKNKKGGYKEPTKPKQ